MHKLVKTIKEANSIRQACPEEQGRPSWKGQDERRRLIVWCIDQTIVALKLALSRTDNALDRLEKEWVEKEILMQYRLSLHGQIDSLIRLKGKNRD